MSIDRRTIGSSIACRCTSVSITSGSASVKNPPPWIGGSCAGIAQHQDRHAERQQVAAEFGVDHRAFVDDDQLGLGGRRLVPQVEGGDFLAALARPVDQAVYGGGALAAFAAHHGGRLAGESGELDLAVGMFGQMAGERGLAGAGIAKQAEHLRCPV